ncbi:hypothetical protein BGZ91_011875, partial [Linnemannia elongata]
MNRALVMLDIFGKQIEQQDLDVSATVGSTGSLMLVCRPVAAIAGATWPTVGRWVDSADGS